MSYVLERVPLEQAEWHPSSEYDEKQENQESVSIFVMVLILGFVIQVMAVQLFIQYNFLYALPLKISLQNNEKSPIWRR